MKHFEEFFFRNFLFVLLLLHFRDRVFSRWRERLFFLTTDSLVSIDTEGRRLGDHAFLEVDCDAIVCKHCRKRL